jgi:phenylalanyl-tRNA synthetase beta chain
MAMMAPQVPVPHWQQSTQPVDFFAMKGVVEILLDEVGAPHAGFRQATRPPFHPGRCAVISIDSQDIGVMGEVHPDVRARYDLSQRAYIALIEWDSLARHLDILKPYAPVPRFPSADRDLALVLPQTVPAAHVESVLHSSGGSILREVRIFDVYTGAPIPEGSKSMAIALRFQANDRTLTDAEVEAAMTQLRQAATRELGANLR